MSGYIVNIEEKTKSNENFREVLFTGPNSQLVVMSLAPGEEIGAEVHSHIDQFLRIEQGEAKIVLDGEETLAQDDYAIVVPAGVNHNVINVSTDQTLKLYTIYSPAEHAPGTIHKTRAEALADEHQH
jgi:mannose-6-phosphate isomerase-like protein (cupin superfamily)